MKLLLKMCVYGPTTLVVAVCFIPEECSSSGTCALILLTHQATALMAGSKDETKIACQAVKDLYEAFTFRIEDTLYLPQQGDHARGSSESVHIPNLPRACYRVTQASSQKRVGSHPHLHVLDFIALQNITNSGAWASPVGQQIYRFEVKACVVSDEGIWIQSGLKEAASKVMRVLSWTVIRMVQ